jgi:hypothetical protein
MQGMAQYGRNGDTMMAHVAPGEMVVPPEVLQRSPEVARGLGMAFADAGADPMRYTVGSGQNSINPVTGEPEFFLDKILEYGSKFLGGGGGNFFSNPIVQGAISNVALKAITGGKPSLRDALLGGIAGGGLGYMSGGDSGLGALFGMDTDVPSVAGKAVQGGRGNIFEKPGERKDYLGSLVSDAVNKPKYKRAEGLLGIGDLFNLNPDEGIGRLLNNKAGEAIAMGLGSQLLDSVFGKDYEETDLDRAARRSNQTYAEAMADPTRVKLGDVMRLNEGGATYFPRRDGGIMPSEGSGTKDDVPAMLTAGEFVMTRDAVKGAGNGNLNQGIQKMYGMMDKLEDIA